MAEHTIPDWDAHCLRAQGLSTPRAARQAPILIEGSTIYQLSAALSMLPDDQETCPELQSATDTELVYLILAQHDLWGEHEWFDCEKSILGDLELMYFDSYQELADVVARLQQTKGYNRTFLEDIAIEAVNNGQS